MLRLPPNVVTPEEEELDRKRARLAELEAELADRELELASLLAELVHFERQYLESVGRRYAILDELKAKIAETRARKNLHNPGAQKEAKQARAKADESGKAAGGDGALPPTDSAASSSKASLPESLRKPLPPSGKAPASRPYLRWSRKRKAPPADGRDKRSLQAR